MKPLDTLAIAQINRRIQALRKLAQEAAVRGGWISYSRHTLGMTLKQLSLRAGVSLSTVAQAERGEAAGQATLATLKKMAHAMDCELVYAFVPRADLDQTLRQAALEKAKKTLDTADVHMTLEDQRVSQSIEERIERLAEKLLKSGDVW